MTSLEEVVKRFLYLLDIKEESDGGKIFHPNYIGSCRIMDGIELEKLISQMKDFTKETINNGDN